MGEIPVMREVTLIRKGLSVLEYAKSIKPGARLKSRNRRKLASPTPSIARWDLHGRGWSLVVGSRFGIESLVIVVSPGAKARARRTTASLRTLLPGEEPNTAED